MEYMSMRGVWTINMEKLNKHSFKAFVEYNSDTYQMIATSNQALLSSFFNAFKTSLPDNKKDYYPYELCLCLRENVFYLCKVIYCKYAPQVLAMRKDSLTEDDLLVVKCNDYLIKDCDAVFVKDKMQQQEYNQLLYYPFEFGSVFLLDKDGLSNASKTMFELLNLDLNTLFEINSIKLIQDMFYQKIKSLNYDFEKVLSFEDYYEFKKDNRGMIYEIHYS